MNGKKLYFAAGMILLVLSLLTFTSCGMSGDKTAAEGKKLYTAGSYAEALEKFTEAEEAGLKNFRAAELYYCMGNCFYHLENYGKCVDYQLKCVEAEPEYFSGWGKPRGSLQKNRRTRQGYGVLPDCFEVRSTQLGFRRSLYKSGFSLNRTWQADVCYRLS